MLPALAVHTPAAIRSGATRPIAFAAARILKEPTGCRTSSLRWISRPESGSRRSGVRSAIPATLRRAWRISSTPTGSRFLVAASSEPDPLSEAGPARAGVDVVRAGNVLDREADRLEDRHVGGRGAAGNLPDEDLPEVAEEVVLIDLAVLQRNQEVAGL